MVTDDEFFEDDEPVEDVRAAFRRGEKRRTAPRDLNQRAKSVVDHVVARSEATHISRVPLRIVASGTSARIIRDESPAPADALMLVPVSVAEYPVG